MRFSTIPPLFRITKSWTENLDWWVFNTRCLIPVMKTLSLRKRCRATYLNSLLFQCVKNNLNRNLDASVQAAEIKSDISRNSRMRLELAVLLETSRLDFLAALLALTKSLECRLERNIIMYGYFTCVCFMPTVCSG